MKSLKQFRQQQLSEAVAGMTVKQHAEKTRQLKAEVAKREAEFHKANEAHGKAKDALEAHRRLDPKYAKKQDEKSSKGWAGYIEPGRGREPSPSGGMGAR